MAAEYFIIGGLIMLVILMIIHNHEQNIAYDALQDYTSALERIITEECEERKEGEVPDVREP